MSGHSAGTAGAKPEEGAGDGRSVCPESPGLHAGCNGRDNGFRPRKGEVIPKPGLSWNCGLKLARMNAESLVIAGHYPAVNTSLLLVHTARHSTQARPRQGAVLLAVSSLGLVRGEKS